MKLALVAAILLLAAPEAAVRFESEGVRVGTELVSGKELSLKGASGHPILVSGTVVENLSAEGKVLSVALGGERSALLETGVRLERAAEGFRLSTHGPAFTVEAGGKKIEAEKSAAFKATEKGFDFGTLGTLEGASLVAKLAKASPQGRPTPQDPRRRTTGVRGGQARLVFANSDPAAQAVFVSGESLRQLDQVTPTGAP
jgi:hypothetical protein